jgi:hypothetical protein
MARNRTRAARRIAERTARNAAAAADIAENRLKRRNARHKTVLERLEIRGSISPAQRRAGDRLARDHAASNTLPKGW